SPDGARKRVYARLQRAMRHPGSALVASPGFRRHSIRATIATIENHSPMIRITDRISIDDAELAESFIRASGPGGQNVNKLASSVQLRFDVRHSPSLPNDVRVRLERLAGRRLTRDGVLVITAQRHRTQERNRADARERLLKLIRQAAIA